MNKEAILGIIRHLLTAAGGALVSTGLASETSTSEAIGAIITLVGFVWSVIDKRSRSTSPPNAGIGTQTRSLLFLLCGALLLSGCATTRLTEEQKLNRVVTVSTLAANTGTRIALIRNPDYRPHFETALAGLEVLLAEANYDPLALRAVLSQLPLKELRSAEGALIVDAAVILFDAYAAEMIDLDRVRYLRPVIQGIRDGIARALEAPQ